MATTTTNDTRIMSTITVELIREQAKRDRDVEEMSYE